jgi:hypothetical protein
VAAGAAVSRLTPMETVTRLKIETAASAGLASSPFWIEAMQNLNLIASTIAAVSGAIYGLYTMWRLYTIWREKRADKE